MSDPSTRRPRRIRPAPTLAVLLALTGLLPAPATAQSHRIRFDRLSIAEGLSQGSGNTITQDSRGFIWIGTQDGLNRYDGSHIKVYRHDPDDPNSLVDNFIVDIREDETGALWILYGRRGMVSRFDLASGRFRNWIHDPDDEASIPLDAITAGEESAATVYFGLSENGIARLDLRTGLFSPLRHDPDDPRSLSDDHVRRILKTRDGTLWIATRNGLNRMLGVEDGKRRFERYFYEVPEEDDGDEEDDEDDGEDAPPPHNHVFALLEDLDGELWIGTPAGVDRLDPATGEVTHLHDVFAGADARDGPVFVAPFLAAADGWLWCRTGDNAGTRGLLRYQKTTGELRRYTSDPAVPTGLQVGGNSPFLEDRDGTVWIGSRRGLNRYDAENDTFINYRNHPADPTSLGGDDVGSLFEDHSGVLWIGLNGDGVNRYSRDKHKFVHYNNDPDDPSSLQGDMVFAVYEDRRGTLWAGSAGGGLHRFDENAEKVVERYFNDVDDPQGPRDLGSDDVRAVYEDQRGRFWVGTVRGLVLLDRDEGRVVHRYFNDPDDENSLLNNGVRRIFEDSLGNFWLANGILVRFNPHPEDPAKALFKRYMPDDDAKEKPPLGINAFVEDTAGRFWIGHARGFSLMDRDAETFKTYSHNPRDPNSLSHDRIMGMYEDPDGSLWISTYGGGLNRFDPRNETFQRWTTQDGLPSDSLYGIIPDDDGNLWIGSNGGLAKLDPRTMTFTNFDVEDGLQSNEFNDGAYARGPVSGAILMGGLNGFNRFHPSDIRYSDFKPPVVLTAFKKFDRPVDLDRSLDQVEEVTIGYKENFFAFEFAALDFSRPSKNQYAYKLDDFNEDWIAAGTRNYASYTNLDGGTYTFRVMGTNGDGVWNEAGTSIRVVVIPPPWKTWWAYCLYALSIVGLVVGYVRYKTAAQKEELRRQREEAEHLRAIDRMKDEFLANTSHELRTPLNGIIGIAQSLIDGVTGSLPETTRSNLFMVVSSGRRLAHLVDDILDFSKLKKHEIKLRRNAVDLHELTGFVLTLSRPLVANKHVELLNDVPAGLPPVDADVNRLQQILHNLVGNAVKFTDAGTVRVLARVEQKSAEAGEGTVEVTVADTGVGIPAEKLDRIFESFEQADGSTARTYGGTGLGLTITRQLVSLHGGTIRAESEVGEGTRLVFTLPVWDESRRGRRRRPTAEGQPTGYPGDGSGSWSASSSSLALAQVRDLGPVEPIHLDAAPGNGNGDGAGVLIVDDEPVNLQVLRNVLTLEGFRISEAHDGKQCLDLLKEGKAPDIILLDVMMPGLTGLQVTEEIRTQFSANDLPIVLVTAKNQVRDLEKGLASGANDYLTKPFSRNELLARMRMHLSLARAHTMEAENRRKTEELEQARMIQLSLLPKKPPEISFLDIAAHMETATEVGGDYYDFFTQDDGSLYVVTGDATGHGISAGMVVSMTKASLKALDVHSPHILLKQLNQVLRAVHLERMQMALNVTYLTDKEIVVSSAAMPPVYVGRARDATVEEILLPALPLGARDGMDYGLRAAAFNAGDVVLQISDGLPEQVNAAGDQLGYEPIVDCLALHVDKSAQEILEALLALGRDWAGGEAAVDDVTIVVMKRRA